MTNAPCRFLLLVCFAGALFAQGDRGSITGAVTDSGGARIPAARMGGAIEVRPVVER